ncbi:MAG: GldG family protein [Brevinematia bacterium]
MIDFLRSFFDFLKKNYKFGIVTFFFLLILFITLLSFFGFKIGVVFVFIIFLLNTIWITLAGTRLIEDIKSGKILRGIEDITILALTLAILIVLYIIASNRSMKIDLTSEKLYSLSQYTLDIIKSLDKEVKITLFAERDSATELEKILEEYSKNSPKITFTSIDPIRDPLTAKKYELSQGEKITIVIESGENKKYVRGSSLIEYQQTTYGPKATGIKVEEEVTSSILNVTGTSRVIYFLTGNGEYKVLGSNVPGDSKEYSFTIFKSYLEKANYILKELNLSTTKEIPNDAGAIVIMAPRKIIPLEIQDKLYTYFTNGGGLAIFLEPILGNITYDRTFSINYLLLKLGFYVKNNIVFDQERFNPYIGRLFYIMPYIHFSPITSDIKSKGLPVQLVTAMAIGRMENIEGQLGYRYYDLMSTSEDSWGEVNLPEGKGIVSATPDEKDIKPPIILGYAIEKISEKDKTKTGKMVILGDIDFLSDYFIESMSGNLELALNTIEWVSKESGSLGIKPKSIKREPVVIPSYADANLILVLSLIVVPLLMVLPGIIIWFVRSKKIK